MIWGSEDSTQFEAGGMTTPHSGWSLKRDRSYGVEPSELSKKFDSLFVVGERGFFGSVKK